MSEDTEHVIDVADAATYDTTIWSLHRCCECYALLLSDDVAEHIAWHQRGKGT